MCKTNHVGLPQVLDHAVHTQRFLGQSSEPLKSCGVGGLCDFGVTPVPIGLGFGFRTALGLGLRGPDLGLGLDNILRFAVNRAS